MRRCFLQIFLCGVLVNGLHLNDDFGENGTRFKRQVVRPQCKQTDFTCKNGDCTDEVNLCDGKADCSDSSDELNCAANRCPPYTFRCAYGACINSDSVCDGKQDCRDNSDETNPRCKKKKCDNDQFECKDGQCIEESNLCDGPKHCNDGSDESVEACSSITCPTYTFRCEYGACINSDYRCSGERVCADGSDEAGCPGAPVVVTPTTKKPPVELKAGECRLPNYQANGKYTVYQNSNNVPGDIVSNYSVLIYTCNPQYKLYPSNNLHLCGALPPFPKCLKTCSSIDENDSMKVTCSYKGAPTECKNPYEDTRATLECKILYEEPSLVRDPYRYCKDGSWDKPIPPCEPACGHKSGRIQTFVIGGKPVTRGEYPWQVAIYRDYENICGGSILTPKYTLSAAHCFEDKPKENYIVAAGKYYLHYNDTRDDLAQFSKLSELIIHDYYRNGKPHQAWDIAILGLTTPFKITEYVLPVCFRRNIISDVNIIGKKGIVTGWGKVSEGGPPSEVLKYLEVEYKTVNECTLPPDIYTYYIPYAADKMCAGKYRQSQSVCQGDSGGGLVFQEDDARYYIRGIVSLGPQKKDSCDSQQFTLYTNVSFHAEYIDERIRN